MPQDLDSFELDDTSKRTGLNFNKFIDKNKLPIAAFFSGLIMVGVGVLFFKQGYLEPSEKIEVINVSADENKESEKIVVEISGSIEKPGVYNLSKGARVEDLLIVAGGLSASADRAWVEKYVNRAAKLTDGQKLYILKVGEQSNIGSAKNSDGIKTDQGVLGVGEEGLVNINTGSLNDLDSLPGIGQVYGQSIIDHRPYSSVEELLSKGALRQNVYDKVKDKVTVY